MEPTDARRHERGPAPTPATGIEAHGVARQPVPRKARETPREHPPQFGDGARARVEAPPLPTEIIDGGPIEIGRIALHCCRLRYGQDSAHVTGGNRFCLNRTAALSRHE